MPKQFRLFAVVPMVVTFACAPKTETATTDTGMAMSAATDPAVVRQSIEAANTRFVDALKKGDTATMAMSYADDAVVMPPNAPAMRGGADIKKGFADMLAMMTTTNFSAKTDDVMVGGDLAVETGTYEWSFKPIKGGKEATEKGKYVTVWKRQADGSWKCIRDIFNSDTPMKM
jgi:uncharacterized protein (TIGR02246 family)